MTLDLDLHQLAPHLSHFLARGLHYRSFASFREHLCVGLKATGHRCRRPSMNYFVHPSQLIDRISEINYWNYP